MMSNSESFVDGWLANQRAELAPDELASLLARALTAIWDRAHVTLGDVTLDAVFQRVWSTAVREFPVLAPFNHRAFRHVDLTELANADSERLRAAVRFVLMELLTVIGRLTAEILTPGLHAALSAVGPTGATPSDQARRGNGGNGGRGPLL
jgi:hypothetical protein